MQQFKFETKLTWSNVWARCSQASFAIMHDSIYTLLLCSCISSLQCVCRKLAMFHVNAPLTQQDWCMVLQCLISTLGHLIEAWCYINASVNCVIIGSGRWVHYDVIKWKHFPRYWPFVQGIHRSLVNSPHKGQWRGALMFSLICAWINGCVNNHDAGDLRCHRAHYDIVMGGLFWHPAIT